MSNLDQFVLKPSADALIAFAGTSVIVGTSGEIEFGPMLLAPPMALAATAYATNITFGVIKNQLEKIQPDKVVALETGLLGPVLNGALMVVVARGIMGPYSSNEAIAKVFGVGVLSAAAGPSLHAAVAPSLM